MKKRLLADLPGTRIINSYGSTEAAGVIYIDYRTESGRLDSIGKPAPGVAVRVVDDQCREMASGRERPGRLAIRGDVVMAGYWQNGEPSREAIVDGWLMTNDLAYIEDGFVYLLGRVDDMINTGGKKTAPLEIENAVSAFPGVSECCCVAAPDAILGSVPVVFVAPHNRERFSEAALYQHLAGILEKYKMPRRVIPLDAIPKNHMGKYERKKLVELLKTMEER
jgi:long-chain acyl-CoA synthetase